MDDNCNPYLIACQIDRLVDAVSQGPSGFEVAQFWVSVAGTLLTLLVALIAVKIAWNANELTRGIQEKADKKARRAVAAAVTDVVSSRAIHRIGNPKTSIWLPISWEEPIRKAMVETDDAAQLSEVFMWIDGEIGKPDFDADDAERVDSQAERVMMRWVEDPKQALSAVAAMRAEKFSPYRPEDDL